ncbi:MAG: efflux RND transporter periplasmic adaptor subunit [Planctomycetota bacterium]
MSDVDLSGLRIDSTAHAVPRRPLGPRLMVLAVAALLLVVATTFLWPLLRPARVVRMAQVRAASGAVQLSSAATAEAVGWVEADPFPVNVRPLVAGRIESIDVLEGTIVKRGETVIATLASAELLAAHDRNTALLAEREAALRAASANHQLAEDNLQQNAEARLRVRDAESKLLALDTRLANNKEQQRRAVAMQRSAGAAVTAQEQLEAAGNSYPVALERARADADAARAGVAAADADVAGLLRERTTMQAALQLSEELAEQPVALRGAVAVASAEVQKAEAALAAARTELAVSDRELAWTTVTSPVHGVVMRLLAQPGDTVGPDSMGIVALYDPTKLRARIDVPLDSIDKVHAGQQVEVRSQVIGDMVVRGVVQRLQQESDLLKNTLQVKIGLFDPPPLLRPETLCRARFLAPAQGEPGAAATAVQVFRVPQQAVQNGQVFVFHPASKSARAIRVEVVGQDGDLRLVRGELSVTQRVILDPVTAGEVIAEAQP